MVTSENPTLVIRTRLNSLLVFPSLENTINAQFRSTISFKYDFILSLQNLCFVFIQSDTEPVCTSCQPIYSISLAWRTLTSPVQTREGWRIQSFLSIPALPDEVFAAGVAGARHKIEQACAVLTICTQLPGRAERQGHEESQSECSVSS
jgi:hypothetical protein